MTLPEPLASYDPGSSSWRTCEDYLPLEVDGYSGEFSGPWPTSGMTRAGMVYARPMSERRMVVSGCSLLPTPRTSDTNGAGAHGYGGPDLRTAISLLPTPMSRDYRIGYRDGKAAPKRVGGAPLNDVVQSLGDDSSIRCVDGNL